MISYHSALAYGLNEIGTWHCIAAERLSGLSGIATLASHLAFVLQRMRDIYSCPLPDFMDSLPTVCLYKGDFNFDCNTSALSQNA